MLLFNLTDGSPVEIIFYSLSKGGSLGGLCNAENLNLHRFPIYLGNIMRLAHCMLCILVVCQRTCGLRSSSVVCGNASGCSVTTCWTLNGDFCSVIMTPGSVHFFSSGLPIHARNNHSEWLPRVPGEGHGQGRSRFAKPGPIISYNGTTNT